MKEIFSPEMSVGFYRSAWFYILKNRDFVERPVINFKEFSLWCTTLGIAALSDPCLQALPYCRKYNASENGSVSVSEEIEGALTVLNKIERYNFKLLRK
jgi:hypothetical protein